VFVYLFVCCCFSFLHFFGPLRGADNYSPTCQMRVELRTSE
jgi:hypothetical protein